MKTFIYKTLAFLAFSLILITAIFFLTFSTINRKASFVLNENIEYVILGHSHSEYAFNDALIKKSKNLSQSAEAYFYTLIKLRRIISQNKNVNTVFIEFSNNQIDKKMDSWMFGEKYISEKLPLYSPFMEKEDIDFLYSNSPVYVRNTISKSFRKNLISMASFNLNYIDRIGGYQKLERTLKNIDIQDLEDSFNSTKVSSIQGELSDKNIEYLEKIIALCMLKNIKIYLVRSPKFKYYPFLKNEETYQWVKNTKFGEVELLDFSKYPSSINEFADDSHLNSQGATKFSKFFNNLIENGMLDRMNKQDYINSQMLNDS